MGGRIHIWMACVVTAFFAVARANAGAYTFKSYQVENGLSQNSVLSILQDREGFMWFGTKDGLNCFDGYSFKVYRRQSGVETSLGNNFVFSSFGSIGCWVGFHMQRWEFPNTESHGWIYICIKNESKFTHCLLRSAYGALSPRILNDPFFDQEHDA